MKQKSKYLYIGIATFVLLIGLFVWGKIAYAQISSGTEQLYDPLNSNSDTPLTDLLQRIINYLVMISTPIITAMILWGGIQMLIAQDNETKFEKGVSTLKHAVYGAVVVILSSGILLVVKDIIGLK